MGKNSEKVIVNRVQRKQGFARNFAFSYGNQQQSKQERQEFSQAEFSRLYKDSLELELLKDLMKKCYNAQKQMFEIRDEILALHRIKI